MTSEEKLRMLQIRRADALSVLEDSESDSMFLELGKITFKISQLQKKINRKTKNLTDEE